MRILHTSDWHLGVSLGTAPRHEEHRLFLDWLLDEIKKAEVDALLIAGDVYHYSQPSAAAQSMFFEFLAKCQTIESLQHVVVIAGNHDSPSRLDAPRSVLETLGVTVIGSLPTGEDAAEVLVPLHGEGGAVEAVVVAVPYLSESRLGLATTDVAPAELHAAYVNAFATLYDEMAALAQATYGDVPNIAMGHLTCVGPREPREGDYYTPIHQFGAIKGIPPSIFSESYCYAALGHIHRGYQIGDSIAWYSGSPVPVSVVESRSPRKVNIVDIGERTRVRTVTIPRWRDVFEVAGDPEEAATVLRELTWDSELPPYLYIDVELKEGDRADVDRYQKLLARHFPNEPPRIVRFRTLSVLEVEEDEPKLEFYDDLENQTPTDVFRRMYVGKYSVEPPDSILSAFAELLREEVDGA